LLIIGVNTLSLRAKFRDYYDLYVISRERFSVAEIFEIAAQKIPGLTRKIFAMQLAYTDDIEDESIVHLEPEYNVTLGQIRKHFENEIKKLI
jgi:hypothetical protein